MRKRGCWRLARIGLVIVSLSLTGCATGDSSGPVVCPPLIDYDPATLARAADAVDALPADSPLVGMLADYATTRAQIRACRAARSTP